MKRGTAYAPNSQASIPVFNPVPRSYAGFDTIRQEPVQDLSHSTRRLCHARPDPGPDRLDGRAVEECPLDLVTLKSELKHLIVDTLRLEEIAPEEIEDDMPLFGKGLGLDSVDALELVVALEKAYGVVIEDEEVGKEAFASVEVLARFVRDRVKEGANG